MNVIERTSGYDATDNICWYFGNKGDTKPHGCQCPAHACNYDKRALATFGRCRSGARWFWSARTLFTGVKHAAHSFAVDEAAAMNAAMAAVRGFRVRIGVPILAHASHGCASLDLKELNKAKRLAQPSDATDSRVVEYLYSNKYNDSELGEKSYYSYYRFRILKRTKKRIFYLRKKEEIDEHGVPIDYANIISSSDTDDNTGMIDRQKLEAEKRVSSGHTWDYDWHLFASLEDALADSRRHDKPEVPVDLAALKAAMAAAHPDKGGSNAAFIEARARYVAARRAQRHKAASADTHTP
jgi:hypothetical protein